MTEGARLVDLMAPVGPVAEAFVGDERFLSAIMGPYGSAKTTSCIRKIWNSVGLQHLVGGVRRARWCVVRDTYQQLETNVLNSWFTWFPKTKENWNGREMCHRLRYQVQFPFEQGRAPEVWELEMYFRAMGDQKAEQVLKGLELTGLWLNEVDTLDKSVLRFGLPRTGRYPSAKDGGCAWSGVIADFNAPDIDNWTYGLYVEKDLPLDPETIEQLQQQLGRRFGIGFWRQPGGRSVDPEPENIRNLPPGYYQTMLLGLSENDIRRFVDNEFGAVRNGQPVYPEFNDDFHTAREPLKPVPGISVCAGLDGGNTPALVFGQKLENGQIRTLDELVVFNVEDDKVLERLGPYAFGEMGGAFWVDRFPRAKLGTIWGDPAIWYGEHASDEERSWIQDFERGWKAAAGFAIKVKPSPVKGNRLSPRLEAVRRGLVHNVGGGQPGQIISPTCKRLRRGFLNGYVIVRVQLSNGMGRWKDEPLKNDFSHVHDAKQYLDVGLTKAGDMAIAGEAQARGRPSHRPKPQFGTGHFAHRGG